MPRRFRACPISLYSFSIGSKLNGKDGIMLSKITGTDHDDKCEACESQLTHANLVESKYGFYCSSQCRDESENGSVSVREDFHADG